MTFPLHYFVKTSILNLVLLIPDVSIIQYKYLSIADHGDALSDISAL